MITLMRSMLLALCASLVVGCGGGASFGGGTTGTGGGGGGGSVAALALVPSSTTMPNTANSSTAAGAVTITAIAKDASNNVVAGVPVTFNASSGTIVVSSPTTNSSGEASAILHTGGDTSLRTITVTATAGGVTATTSIQVVNPSSGAPPASLTLLLSTPQLSSNADTQAEGVTVTGVVRDTSNNVIEGVPVTFSSDSGEIIVVNGNTNSNGRANAVLTTGGDPTNRTIHVTVSTGSFTQSADVKVIGTTLSISGPDATQINTPTDYTVLLLDSSGNGISGKVVNVSTNPGNALSANTLTTDAGGQAIVTLTPTVAASTLTVNALGMTTTKSIAVSTDQFTFLNPAPAQEVNIGVAQTITVRWLRSGAPVANGTVINFAVTRGTLSASSATTTNGIASVTVSSSQAGFSTIVASSSALTHPSASEQIEFVATTPSSISVQANPATIATNQSTDITAIVRDAANNLVKNQTIDFSLLDSTGGVLSQPTAVTNSQGVATIRYTASLQSSASQAIKVTGRIRGTAISDTASITVGASAVRISMGTGAEIASKDTSTYQDPFTVLVTDAAGNPVPDAEFRLQIRPVSYFKGTRSEAAAGATLECPNEDINFNDILDPGEDINGNGTLEPGRPASVPSTITLDPDDGTGQFFVTYPKEFGEFVKVDLFGIASVAGTETVEKRRFVLRVGITDQPHLPDSPFGIVHDCTNPN